MENDQDVFSGGARRIYRYMFVLAGLGTLAALLLRGWNWGLGFLAGSLVSMLNFRWLHQLTEALGETTRRRGKGFAVILGLRYLLFGIGAYVIVVYFNVSLTGLLLGLLVSVSAVLLEMLYELIYGRT